jgi:hypothetical protein
MCQGKARPGALGCDLDRNNYGDQVGREEPDAECTLGFGRESSAEWVNASHTGLRHGISSPDL